MPAPRPLKRLLAVVLAVLVGLLAISGQAGAQTPGAPAITSVTAGDGSLAVAWTAPSNQGGSTITSYDLRHIETDDDETVDANWSVETGAGTSGSLADTVGGLDGDVSYDVQVRAVNSEGPGDWSSTSTGTPGVGVPTIYSVIVQEGQLNISWSAPPFAGPDAVTSYDLRYIETSADETVESNWTVEQPVWIRGPGLLLHVLDDLTKGTSYDIQVRAVTLSVGDWSTTASGTPVEYGDTLLTATNLTIGTAVGGRIDPGTDADYFKVVLARATGFLIFTEGELDTVGQLLRSDGTVIDENDDGYLALGIRNFAIWDSLTAGIYYIKVTSYNEATGAYRLFTRPITDSSSRSNAQSISLDGVRTGLIDPSGDVDWFTFTLTKQTRVILRGSSRIEGEILDSGGNPIDDFELFELPASGFVHLVDLAAGKYYIEVKPVSVFLDGLYSLYVLEAAEPGSTRAEALPLTIYRAAVGTIDPTTDTDYFRIDLDDAIHARLWAIGADDDMDDVDITGELLDSSGNPVSSAVVYETSFDRGGPLGFVLLHELSAGTHYIKVTRNTGGTGSTTATGSYAVLLSEHVLYADLVERCESIPVSNSSINDALYGCQWHLNNEGQRKGAYGEDINVEDAWTTTRGSGVNVAVVDDGMQHNHPDLTDNVNRSRNHDYTGGGDGGEIYDPAESHGTQVAGIIAALDNSIGMRGVAPQAKIYGYNYLLNQSELHEATAMTRHMSDTAVSNNSWGPPDNPLPHRATDLWVRAVDSGVADGFGGKGVFYVFGAGNGADDGDYGTLDEYANYYAVTAACAVNDLGRRTSYSELGANLWVCAPSSDFAQARAGIATTNNFGRYTTGFGGTSAAAPQVSGVAALVRAVDSGLIWRDVKLILAASARKNDPDNTGWKTGALKYGSDPSDPQYYEFNHEYGFGVVDAKAAVDLAGSWSKLPAMRKTGPVESTTQVTIPTRGSRSSTISVDSDIDFTEFVEVKATFNAPEFRDLQVELVSPRGKESVLSVPESDNCPYERADGTMRDCRLVGTFRFGSARHLGENPSGTWTLKMSDRSGGRSNQLQSWNITVYGHRSTPDAPALERVVPGANFLTVSWSPPVYSGTSDVSGYDVRHIRSDSRNKANDSAWTVIEPAGAATTRSYTIAMLDDGARRDVQVRAANDSGGGDWSVTGRGTPSTTNSEPFFVEGLQATRTVREDAVAGRSIGMPFTAQDAERSDTFTFTLGGRDDALFDIDSLSGQLSVKDPLDYEKKASHQVTVSVRDSKDAIGNADTADDATINVTVVVEDVNEPPELIGDRMISYLENGIDEVIEFTAEDPEGTTVIWGVLGGTDKEHFNFTDGKLEFKSSPDREMPADQGGDNTYDVVVTVSDGARSADEDVMVTVTDVNEPFNLEGDRAFDYDENDTGEVAVFRVDDPENGPIDWDLSGTDRGDFTINEGRFEFAAVPDYEKAADSNRDNIYHVTVTASDGDPLDGANQESLSVIVTVADLDEPGTVTLSSLQPQVGTALSATLDEPDRGLTGLTWTWHSSASQFGLWEAITGAGSRTYTPADADENRYLRVTASYSDKHGPGKTVRAVSDGAVQPAPPTNAAPEFPATNDVRSVAENTAQDSATGRSIGLPVEATDTDNDTLTYSLGGTHAQFFDVDSRSGQLRTKTELNYESRASYPVTVTARDPSNASDLIRVTISITNVEETGAVTFSSKFPRVGRSLTATLADPEGGVSGTVWEWYRSTRRFGGWVLIDGADSRTYSPVDADLDHYLRAFARYTDRLDPQLQESAEAATLDTVSQRTGRTTKTTTRRGGGGGVGGGGGPAPSDEPADPPPAGFTDVNATSVHAKNIDALYAAEITTGCGTDPLRFCPDGAVTRAQMASFLARAFDLVEVEQLAAGFVDVDSSSVHAASIEALFAAGITTGCGTEPLRFCPDGAVTRAQMASFLARAFDLVEVEQLAAGFVDVDSSSVHAASIEALFAAGITTGCGIDPLRFCPDLAVTRAQMASLLIRALDAQEQS